MKDNTTQYWVGVSMTDAEKIEALEKQTRRLKSQLEVWWGLSKDRGCGRMSPIESAAVEASELLTGRRRIRYPDLNEE